MIKKVIDLVEYTGKTPIEKQLEIAKAKLALANSQYQKILGVQVQLASMSRFENVFDDDLNDVMKAFERLYNKEIIKCRNIAHACRNNIIRGSSLPEYIVKKNIGYQQVIYAYNRISSVYESALLLLKIK